MKSEDHLATRTPKARSRRGAGPDDVPAFLAALEHPHKDAIVAIREIIRKADPRIAAGIKWNAPSFRTSESFATFHLRARDGVQLILHRGARRRDGNVAVADPDSLLEWLGADRASVRFRDVVEVRAKRAALTALVRAWIVQV